MAISGSSFLGTGWGFPPTFLRASVGVEMVSGERDIHESLTILFNTSLGERVLLPEYGCQLDEFVFQARTTTTMTEMERVVRMAILDWEPRITVEDVRIEGDSQNPALVKIAVEYTVRLTNTRSNFVYPFYTHEATIAPRGP